MILFNKYLKNKITGEEICDVYELANIERNRLEKPEHEIKITECDDIEDAWKMMAVCDQDDLNYIASLYQLIIDPVEE